MSNIKFKIVRIENDQEVNSYELTTGELDLLYLGLEDYSQTVDWNQENESTAELSGLLHKMGNI